MKTTPRPERFLRGRTFRQSRKCFNYIDGFTDSLEYPEEMNFRSLALFKFVTALPFISRVILGFGLLALASNLNANPVRIFLIGDSTAADKPVTPANPERGWGQLLPLYLKPAGTVINHAKNGRSTKSFLDEGSWERVRAALRPGDWVIIQFGHNDEKKNSPRRYADLHDAYPANLRRFINDARAASAHPILATPIVRRAFNREGELSDTHGAYPDAVRQVARDEVVPLLELHDLTRSLVLAYGPEQSKKLYLWIERTEYASRPDGVQDDTHLSAVGASRVAELAIAEIRRLNLPLAEVFQ
jgi:lysophospholipase L1-like esterase